MKKHLLVSVLSIMSLTCIAQTSEYNFDDWDGSQFGSVDNSFAGSAYSFSNGAGTEGVITANVGASSYSLFNIYWPTGAIDASTLLPNIVVTARIKSTQDVTIRLDLQDNVNYRPTNKNPKSVTVTSSGGYQDYTFTFEQADFYNTSDEPVDMTSINTYGIYISPDEASSFSGTVTFDWIKIGTAVTSIVSTFEDVGIQLFPNPTYDVIHIMNPNITAYDSYSIHNMSGQEVVTSQSIDPSDSINISDLQPGVYLVSIHGEFGIYQKRIVKK